MPLEFSIKGCPVKIGPKWTQQMLEAALEKEAHPSARDPVTASQLQGEINCGSPIRPTHPKT
jgi:hypothetical protein